MTVFTSVSVFLSAMFFMCIVNSDDCIVNNIIRHVVGDFEKKIVLPP